MPLAIPDTGLYNSNDIALTSHNVTLPSSIVAGNLLLMKWIHNGSATIVTPPLGFSQLATLFSTDTVFFYGKIADGSEGSTVNIVLSGNQRATGTTHRITGARNGLTSSEILISSAVVATTTNPDPPNLSPGWGADEEVLWIADSFWVDSNYVLSSYPTNYNLAQSNNKNGNGSNANSIITAARLLAAASENPGTFSISSAAKTSLTYTTAIRPAPPSSSRMFMVM